MEKRTCVFLNFEDQINSSNIHVRNIGRRQRGYQLPAQAPIPVPAPAFTEANRRQNIMQRLNRLNNTPDTHIREALKEEIEIQFLLHNNLSIL